MLTNAGPIFLIICTAVHHPEDESRRPIRMRDERTDCGWTPGSQKQTCKPETLASYFELFCEAQFQDSVSSSN